MLEIDLQQRGLALKIIHRDPRGTLHVNIAPSHEAQAIGHHHTIEGEEHGILRLFDIELENGLAIGLEVPNKEGALLDADRILAVQQLVFQDILHRVGLHDELSAVDLFFADQLLFLDVIDADFLQEDLEVVFIVVGIAEDADEGATEAHQLLNVNQVPLEDIQLFQGLLGGLELPEADAPGLGIASDDHVLVEDQGGVFDVLEVGDALHALVVLGVPDADVALVGAREKVFVFVREAGVDLVEALEDGLDGVLGGVDDLNGLVAPDGEFLALESTERKDVSRCVDQFCFFILD